MTASAARAPQASRRLFAPAALLPQGWAEDVVIEIDASGTIAAVMAGAQPGSTERTGTERIGGPVIPGMPNLHSHAFQRAMAGLTEHAATGEDSFWTWREVMYGFLAKLAPDQVEAIAAQLYVEMLKSGYTAVGEFHYVHHDLDGRPYGDRTELSERVIAAAAEAGIGITHLPVLYACGGFGGQAPTAGQRRFLNDVPAFLGMVETLRKRHGTDPNVRIGIAPHSLRAVTPAMLRDAVSGLTELDATAPIHIHIAEQTKEVEDCVAWSGQRPIDWLLSHQAVDRRWCLVHATHMTAAETEGVAATGAVAGICATTEANLGDGVFPAPDYLARRGLWGIGSDSHISVSPIEELRWFEYGQRLMQRRRNRLTAQLGGGSSASVGAFLYKAALAGGAAALARPIGTIAPGARADLVVLDGEHPQLYGRSGDTLLDALVFAGNANPVTDVMVGGRWVVQAGRHPREGAIAARFRRAIARLAT
jgi:formimidoylglutamate deiminase